MSAKDRLAQRARHVRGWLAARAWFALPAETFKEFFADEAPLRGAALAFFSLFAVAPLFILVVAAANLLGESEEARSQLFHGAQSLVGPEAAGALQTLVATVEVPGSGVFASILGMAILLFGASRVFAQLEASLNRVWDVTPKKGRNLLRAVRKRFFSFTMVLGLGFLLVVSLILSSLIAALAERLSQMVPAPAFAWQLVNLGATLVVITLVFAAMFRYLPDARIRWSDVGVGAFVTAVLFVLGQFAIGQFLGRSAFSSAYGSAGAVVVVLLWFYYTALIVLFGAEFTHVYARRQGHPIEPESDIAERRGEKYGAGEGGPSV